MKKEKKPLLSEEFLEELAQEINDQFGSPSTEQKEEEKGDSSSPL